ncbi:MAG: hypothetical protein ACK5HJ_01310 [Bacteroidota bacterium]|jgi:hypothetical protein
MKQLVIALYMLMLVTILMVFPLLLQNCVWPDKPNDIPDTQYRPVFMSRADLETSVKMEAARVMNESGKIYLYGDVLLINEPLKGVHMYNNTDPRNPVNIGFIAVPGSHDMALKYNTLYVDNTVDLVAITFVPNTTNIQNITRLRNKFREPTPPDLNIIPEIFNKPSQRGDSIIINWIK